MADEKPTDPAQQLPAPPAEIYVPDLDDSRNQPPRTVQGGEDDLDTGTLIMQWPLKPHGNPPPALHDDGDRVLLPASDDDSVDFGNGSIDDLGEDPGVTSIVPPEKLPRGTP